MSSPRVARRSPLYEKEKVYPRLDALGALHMALTEERRAQVVLQRVADRLIDFAKPFKTTLTNQLLHEAAAAAAQGPGGGAASPLLEDVGPAAAADPAAGAAAAGAEIIEGGVTPLEYGGYDLFALVKRVGLALPSNASRGAAVSFSGKMYGFATRENAVQFAAQPEAFVKSAMERLRAQPELIYLTGATDEFPTVSVPSIVGMMATPQSCDFGTQTPTHFVEKNLDKDYEWNEWALRRRALHLANLRQKSTHGAQTHLSHFRRENTTQVWLPKQSTTQTAVAKGTAMPQLKRYIGGLRGGPEVKMNVVSISLDVGQPHQF